MKRYYRLNGLDCANCAAKLEKVLSKIKGVNEVSISFMNLKMIIDIDDESFNCVFDTVEKTIKRYEPNIEIKRC